MVLKFPKEALGNIPHKYILNKDTITSVQSIFILEY